MRTLVTTGDHFGGRPRRIASVSMNMPLHVGQRHAPERRPSGCMTVPSFGHFHSVSVSSVMISPSDGLLRQLAHRPYPRRSSTTTGMTRVVFFWYSAKFGLWAACCAKSRSRSAPSVTLARPSNVSRPTSTVTTGFARRLWYHAGWVGAPPFEATMT